MALEANHPAAAPSNALRREPSFGERTAGASVGSLWSRDGAVIERAASTVRRGQKSPHRASESSDTGEDQSTTEFYGERVHKDSVWCFRTHRSFRDNVHSLLNEPSSSVAAQGWSFLVIIAITVSVVSFVLETLPDLEANKAWPIIETVCVIIFTFEYVARLAVADQRWAFVIDPLNLVDLVSVAPFYVMKAARQDGGSSFGFVRVIRMIRIFRVFKLGKFLAGITLIAETLLLSAPALWVLLFSIIIFVICVSSLMFYVEDKVYPPDVGTAPDGKMYHVWRIMSANASNASNATLGLNPEELPSFVVKCVEHCVCDHCSNTSQMVYLDKHWKYEHPFRSIPTTCWWCVTTMTTVGYGDGYPLSWGGKVIAMLVMISGLLIIALPVTVLATNFSSVYNDWNQKHGKNVEAHPGYKRAPNNEYDISSVADTESYFDWVREQLQDLLDESMQQHAVDAYMRVDPFKQIAWFSVCGHDGPPCSDCPDEDQTFAEIQRAISSPRLVQLYPQDQGNPGTDSSTRENNDQQ